MRLIWFIVLAVLAFGLGAIGGGTWTLTKSGFASLKAVCEVVRTAERAGVLTKQQVADAAGRIAQRTKAGDLSVLLGELKNGCPNIK